MRLVGSAAFKAVGTSDPRPAGSIPVHLRHLVVAVLAFLVLMPSSRVVADSARPVDTKSVIESVTPSANGVRFDVVGADAFMRVRVGTGHTLVMNGYSDEPFLRIDASGIVRVNHRSSTYAINRSRYGGVFGYEPTGSPSNEPTNAEWVVESTRGEYVWHDHRIHWMSPNRPQAVNAGGLVQQWSIPFVVDGKRIVVAGGLYVTASPGAWWWLLAVPLVVVGFLVSPRPQRTLMAACATVVVVIGGFAYWGLPAVARPAPTLFLLGVAGLLMANVAEALRRRVEIADALVASAGVAVFVAVVLARTMVNHRFVPGIGDEWWVRGALPMVAGCAIGAASTALRRLIVD